MGRNKFYLPVYLSWNLDVDLCPYFKSPNMQFYFFPHCVCYWQWETQNTVLELCKWAPEMGRDYHSCTGLLNFWFLNYFRPCLSYLLLSFLEGPRLCFFFNSRCQCKIFSLSCALRTGASNPFCVEPLPWRAAGTGVFQAGESFWAWSPLLCAALCTLSESSTPWPLPKTVWIPTPSL